MSVKDVTSNCGYQQITSLSSATSLTVPAGPDPFHKPAMALITCETQSVRWRDDGTAPTASIGMLLTAGAPLYYDGELTKIQFIETTASAKLNVSYYF